MVGFLMMHSYSVIGHTPDYTMAEFTIFPSYRRHHYATDAAHRILSTYRGKWEIRYNEKNIAANREFALIGTYEEGGETPELVLYKKR